jgi:mannose-1-phosphate guanylyltransferase
MLHAVVMAGGSGTRFWPESRAARPKQLLDFHGGQTMIQATVARLGTLVPPERVIIATSQALAAPIAEQLPALPKQAILAEPCRRDTAACIGLAALHIAHRDADATMLVMPSDHVISPDAAFQAALSYAAQLIDAQPERIVTFGIRPTYPAESFGYIQRGAALAEGDAAASPTFHVAQFREKPKADVAREYLASCEYYWNAGIFVWKAQTILAALKRFEPKMHACLERIGAAIGRPEYADIEAREFAAIQGKSIDYAVLERHDDVAVVEAPFEWDDVGSWQALARLRGSDAEVGLEGIIVVHTPNATLVARRDREEEVRKIVEKLKAMEEGKDYL